MSSFYWSPGMTIRNMSESFVQEALAFYSGSKQSAANSLGISVDELEVIIKRSQLSKMEQDRRDAEAKRKSEEFLRRSRGMVGADKDGYTALSPYKPVEGLESVEAAGVLASTSHGAMPPVPISVPAVPGAPVVNDPLAAAARTKMLMDENMPKTEGETPNA